MADLHRQQSDISSMMPFEKTVPKKTSRFASQVANSHARTVAAVSASAPPIPKEVENFKTYFIGILVCFGAIAYGYDTGFFGGTIALPAFKAAFGLEVVAGGQTKKQVDEISSNLVSLFQGGSFFGAGAQFYMTERWGRKLSIVVSNTIFIASAFMQTFANGSVGIMMGGRFLGGFAIGISSLVIPVYLSEFAPANVRGRIIGFYDMGIQVGTLLGFWINYILASSMKPSKIQWQIPVFLQLVPAGVLLVGMFFIPETPRWLMSKHRYEEAATTLSRIRNLPVDHEYVAWELTQTREQVEAEDLIRGNDGNIKLVKQLFQAKGHRYRLFLGMALISFKTFSGVQAINYYSPRIFEQLGFKGSKNSLFATGIYGTVKFVFTVIFGLFIVDRIGRRRPLMIGSLVGSFCLFYMGIYLTVAGERDGTNTTRTVGDYFCITFLFLFAANYCFGWNSVPLTLISEIFTQRFRTLSMTFCLMWQWLNTFSIVKIMPLSLTNLGARTYFIFGSIFGTASIFVYFLIPETTGLPLEAMDQLFGGIQRTDAEVAVLDYSGMEKTKNDGQSQHIENLGVKGEGGAMASIPTMPVLYEKEGRV